MVSVENTSPPVAALLHVWALGPPPPQNPLSGLHEGHAAAHDW